MESVLRPMVVYLVLLLFFRLAGKRSLASITPFDLVLVLIVAESIQEAMIGNDRSMTNAFLVVMTIMLVDIGFSLAGLRSARFTRITEDEPIILLDRGKVHAERLRKSRVVVEDILQAARETEGLERLDQIKYAVLETNGGISIIPNPSEK